MMQGAEKKVEDMEIATAFIPDIKIITPKIFNDERGFFMETFQQEKYTQMGIDLPFVQDNHSGSNRGVLRGLHYQIKQPQGKLIWLARGEIFDVAVDLRRSSPTFGHWFGMTLTAKSKCQLWIPPGFAHGFYVVSEWAEVIYKATDIYAPQWERTLLWNDPEINIQWPISDGFNPLVSRKDEMGKKLRDAELFE
jgi:dTDP-4-dehydrorhamnose 3,5-epimerase